jgi:phosphatidylglycerol:prolipoprotein diacylglycerol transferase
MPPRLAYCLFMLLALGVFMLSRRLLPAPPALAARPWWHRTVLAVACLAGGVFGAKLPFAARDGVWLGDGKTLTTGLAGAYLAVELAKFALGLRVKTGDGFALPLAFALAVGRWGCYCNGCCCGVETRLPWGVDFGDGVPRHPTQVYESLFHLSMAFSLLWLQAHGRLRTHLLQFYLTAYCGYRFLTEYLRPEPPGWLGLTFYQWVCAVFGTALALQWVLEEWQGIPTGSERADRLATRLRGPVIDPDV